MTITIQGRYSDGGLMREERTFTAEEATALIKQGHRGMLSFIGQYEIEGYNYHATAVSVGNETYILERDGKLVIPTYFQKMLLANHNEGNQEEPVKVDVIIDPNKVEWLSLTLVKVS